MLFLFKQLLRRAPDLPLFAVPARDRSSHDCIPHRAEDKKDDHQCKKDPAEVEDEECHSDHEGDEKHQKIRYEDRKSVV